MTFNKQWKPPTFPSNFPPVHDTNIIQENAGSILIDSMETCLEADAEESKYVFLSLEQNAEENCNIHIANKSLQMRQSSNTSERNSRNHNCMNEEIKSTLNSEGLGERIIISWRSPTLRCGRIIYIYIIFIIFGNVRPLSLSYSLVRYSIESPVSSKVTRQNIDRVILLLGATLNILQLIRH
jgi:hypothetical protein